MKTRNIILICLTAIAVALIVAPTNSRFPKVSSLVQFVKNWGPVIIPFVKDEPQPQVVEACPPQFQATLPDTMVNGHAVRVPDLNGQVHVDHGQGW
jgi:hypothetical protein